MKKIAVNEGFMKGIVVNEGYNEKKIAVNEGLMKELYLYFLQRYSYVLTC